MEVRNRSHMAENKAGWYRRQSGVLMPHVARHHTTTTQTASKKMDTSTWGRMSPTLSMAQHAQFHRHYTPTLCLILEEPIQDITQSSIRLPALRVPPHHHHYDIQKKVLNNMFDTTTRKRLLQPLQPRHKIHDRKLETRSNIPIYQDSQHKNHNPPNTCCVPINSRLCLRNAIYMQPSASGLL